MCEAKPRAHLLLGSSRKSTFSWSESPKRTVSHSRDENNGCVGLAGIHIVGDWTEELQGRLLFLSCICMSMGLQIASSFEWNLKLGSESEVFRRRLNWSWCSFTANSQPYLSLLEPQLMKSLLNTLNSLFIICTTTLKQLTQHPFKSGFFFCCCSAQGVQFHSVHLHATTDFVSAILP